MKCQILFSGKNKKNNIILSSAENAQRVVKVNVYFLKTLKDTHEMVLSKLHHYIKSCKFCVHWCINEKQISFNIKYLLRFSMLDKNFSR